MGVYFGGRDTIEEIGDGPKVVVLDLGLLIFFTEVVREDV